MSGQAYGRLARSPHPLTLWGRPVTCVIPAMAGWPCAAAVAVAVPCASAATQHPGPWPAGVFVAAARAALRLTVASASALATALGELVTVSWEAGEAALTAVATAEHREQAGLAIPGLGPPRSRCSLTKSRRYMLRKALSVPPPPAPEVLARTLTTVTLRVHGYVGSAPLSPPPRPR